MPSLALVCPFEPTLFEKLSDTDLIVVHGDPAAIPAVRTAVVESGNRLQVIVIELGARFTEVAFSEDWAGTPLWFRAPALGLVRDLVPKLDLIKRLGIQVQLPAGTPQGLTDLRILSSLGVPSCARFDLGPPDWDAVADLAAHALLERVPHAPIEPFQFLATQGTGPLDRSAHDFGRYELDAPNQMLHVDREGRVALDARALAAGQFLAEDPSDIDALRDHETYRERMAGWQERFLTGHPCTTCEGFRTCRGRWVAEDAEPLGCREFFTELLEMVDRQRAMPAPPAPGGPVTGAVPA